jgi:PAS domain S-box-containing protein
VVVSSAPLLDTNGKVTSAVVVFDDITGLKKAEEALRRYELLARHSRDIILFMNYDGGRLLEVNAAAVEAYGYTREELLERTIQDLRAAETQELTAAQMAEAAGRGILFETVHRRKDGTTFPVEVSSQGALIGQVRTLISVIRDITERKQAERALEKARDDLVTEVKERTRELCEKEVLLKEVHHRVKNNLQIISSLVGLQADGSKDDTVRRVLRDVTDRIRSMALVHEKLYQSPDLARVDFAEYVRSLLGYLWRAHGAAAAVQLTLDLEPVSLPVDTAVPCGLILNELAGNALKHAFRGRSEGEVDVSLKRTEGDCISLRLRDNGIGLPAGFDWREARSLGLRLVQMLAGQLKATVEVRSAQGTEFEVSVG